MDDLDYWRLCDELSVMQAAFLTVGVDPSSEIATYCEGYKPHERPFGYEAAKTAIGNALMSSKITGVLSKIPIYNEDSYQIGEGGLDISESRVDVESLRKWLALRGMDTGFFFPAIVETADYLNPANPRYAPKLAAAVRAWQAVFETNGKTPKQALTKWLREHAAKFGLADDDGKPNETGIEETAKVANWKLDGGVEKTPSRSLPTP